MTAATLRELIRAAPFVPFEVILSSGDRYVVDHPEMIFLLKERALIALPPFDEDESLAIKYVTISYLHIAAARPFETSGQSRTG